MQGPRMFVIAGTLVPKTEWKRLPFFIRWTLEALKRLHVLPKSAERAIADTLYMSVKRLGHCWVVPLEALGLVAPHVTYEAIKRAFLEAAAAGNSHRMVVKGQSQGGIYALKLALDPDTRKFVDAVMIDGCPINGTTVIEGRLLSWSQIFPGVREMLPGSRTLQHLHRELHTRWLKRIPLLVVVSPDDALVKPWRAALDVKAGHGAQVQRYVVSPECPADLPVGAVWVKSRHRIGHLLMEWEPEVLDLTSTLLNKLEPICLPKPRQEPTLLAA